MLRLGELWQAGEPGVRWIGARHAGVLVGFYTNSNGNTKGMIAVPQP